MTTLRPLAGFFTSACPLQGAFLGLAMLCQVAPARAQQSAGKLAAMPPAFATIKNTKEFNAVQFGPGNTFAIMKTPPEFQLNEFRDQRGWPVSGDGLGVGKNRSLGSSQKEARRRFQI
jgi:hypothetical protein